MSAERMIALEHAIADLSRRYTAARLFQPLAAQAESELLPRINALGRELRSLRRRGAIGEADLQPVTTEILGLATDWESALQSLRGSSLYREARAAVASGDIHATHELLPRIFAEIEPVPRLPCLYLPFEPSSGRRRPGHSPFLSPAECAQRLHGLLANGVQAEVQGEDWWDRDFPYIACGITSTSLEQPIWLRADTRDRRLALFAVRGGSTHRLYAPRLEAPLQVGIDAAAGDEWWLAYDGSYADFRARLTAELRNRSVPMTLS